MESVASLVGVEHRYGRTLALDGVSASLPSGCMVGLIGPDGVGKSTLLSLLAGVRKVQSGKIEVLGGSIADGAHRRAVCARIAYMPQGLGRNLYPTLSVLENVDFFGRLFGQSAAERAWRIEELLAATGLAPFADRPAGKLSGGMKQKLGLCCALIHDPDLLILDEPTTGVDPLSRKQFWELIDHLRSRRSGMSVLVATAYMEEAERFDHLVAMHGGRILATGTVAAIRERAGGGSLEEAFIALLPEALRAGHEAVILPPRRARDGALAIEAEGLTMRFGDFTAVDHVSVAIEQGEIFGFLGSNGCGKTTTMKMLTGLLAPSEGTAKLFGATVTTGDLETRRRVGYMSQAFSLYGELTCRQNLALHAKLFGVDRAQMLSRINELATTFGLEEVLDELPESLPLGIRQRLQLAAAVLHRPEMLILDEPTSGVDPIARDRFWQLLIRLSRDDGVTIFISTHFMNEALRCDRISLMHAGRILAMDTPEALRLARHAATLEEAFIGYLEEAMPESRTDVALPAPPTAVARVTTDRRLDPLRLWAFARRESMEILRDPIRLAFATLGPIVLLVAMSFGISFDIDRVEVAVLDGDRSQTSQAFIELFQSSHYFAERPPLSSYDEIDRRLVAGEVGVVITIPPGFGRDILTAHPPEVGVWLDGSNTTRAETTRGYVQGVLRRFISEVVMRETGVLPTTGPAVIETRFRYNQAFESINAIAPGVLMLLLAMVPAMLTALGVVREKELGSITNLYAAPASRIEFLLGKQLPYVAVAMLSFAMLVALITLGFGVPLSGSLGALTLGALLYTMATTAFGLVVSTFVRSQIAAIFATAIIVMTPTVNFSGMIYPVSTLEGGAAIVGRLFPAMYFQAISAGTFNKGLGIADLGAHFLALVGFCLVFWLAAALLLQKQER